MSVIPPVDGPAGLPPVMGDPDARRGARRHDEEGESGRGGVGRNGEEEEGTSPAMEQDPNRKGMRLDIRG